MQPHTHLAMAAAFPKSLFAQTTRWGINKPLISQHPFTENTLFGDILESGEGLILKIIRLYVGIKINGVTFIQAL
ncbi:hypothetical protein DN752_19455 [Echinicola strongylocentroti]|uniref:Uncharacterized protein n=1 Tax=Echinicola strongylocentroti TaxID=1795355 RepID=A0A2Z4IN24_9BACT|nr:hypothetical protein DN752_19455 [Echinicola strongylocentroti]